MTTARILVVDDSPDIADLAAMALGSAGYRVDTEGSGEAALDRLLSEAFDLVLLDINMPGMDGWSTLRSIRAEGRLEQLPVVMFSVKGEFRDKVQSMQEGAVDYITKPFAVDELIQRVERVLGGPRPDGAEGSGSA